VCRRVESTSKITLETFELKMSGEVSASISSEGTVTVEGLSIELN
jgi:hypothetical protein